MIPVALHCVPDYDASRMQEAVALLLNKLGLVLSPGLNTLVKPNLVAMRGPRLACTRAEVVRAVCRLLLDAGCKVAVADSPAFGSARGVAKMAGILQALADLPVRIEAMDRPARIPLTVPGPGGEPGAIGVSRRALDADLLVNLPKLKVHSQMRMTAAVKNLFGCAPGFRKAWAHFRFGEQGVRFESMIMDIAQAMPPVLSVLDGVEAMHVQGPTGGRPYALGLMGASLDPVALDTAVYGLFGLAQEDVPLWAEARRRGLPGADPDNLAYPLNRPEDFATDGFVIPENLKPVSFNPLRLVRGRLVSLAHRFKGR
ncbi:MAG: hypothetical protein PWQ57_2988 [Desulfovibrionales bacterium]|jgi:uncharacterized protein (DUF362 family)|nr:hypothetical protein [Desulfovibrionales bacterium]